jgi:hypothetical protein
MTSSRNGHLLCYSNAHSMRRMAVCAMNDNRHDRWATSGQREKERIA